MTDDEKRNELHMKKLASTYAEQYGKELLQELSSMESQGERHATPAFDMRIRREQAAQRRRRTLRLGSAAAAACLALLLVLPGILRTWRDGESHGGLTPGVEAPGAEAPGAVTPGVVTPEVEVPGWSTPESVLRPPDEAESVLPPPAAYEVLPLSIRLPENFTVANQAQDYGKTIYYIEDAFADHVVVTLEKIKDAAPGDKSPLREFSIGGETAYGLYTADYSLLTFEKEDIVYTMTCKYDINTLIRLSEGILI